MSTVHIHVGQGGNQIGENFWLKASVLAKQYSNARRAFYTPGGPGRDEGGHMRAIFVDSEKKVLQRLNKHERTSRKRTAPALTIGHGNVVSCARGCGSNWSMGHNFMPQEKVVNPWSTNLYSFTCEFDYGSEESILKATMEAARREVEACDCFSGFVLWHSLAGGTGSGFGSRLSAELRERYPVAYQMNVTVAPHIAGESPMQPYNELLCLAGLQQDSDAIIIFENDEILDLMSRKTQNSSVSLEDMNSYVSDCMLNLLTPVSSLTSPSGVTVGIEPWELVRSVAPMSPLKLLHCRTVKENCSPQVSSSRTESWESLCAKICQQTRTKFLQSKGSTGHDDSCLAAACICRNIAKPSNRSLGTKQDLDIAKLASKVKNAYNCVKWNPFPVDFWTDEQKALKSGQKPPPKTLTVCSNLTSSGTIHCANLLRSAKIKFNAKAYLYWYERYGTEEIDFENAFEIVRSIVNEYEKAAAP